MTILMVPWTYVEVAFVGGAVGGGFVGALYGIGVATLFMFPKQRKPGNRERNRRGQPNRAMAIRDADHQGHSLSKFRIR